MGDVVENLRPVGVGIGGDIQCTCISVVGITAVVILDQTFRALWFPSKQRKTKENNYFTFPDRRNLSILM